MKYFILLIILSIFISCSSAKENTSSINYGYSEKNAVKVGGFDNGPRNERNYLNSLTGPNGEKVVFNRLGSCCEFKTKNSPFGNGLLDKYAVTYEGKKDTVVLYINMYDNTELKAPPGFVMKK